MAKFSLPEQTWSFLVTAPAVAARRGASTRPFSAQMFFARHECLHSRIFTDAKLHMGQEQVAEKTWVFQTTNISDCRRPPGSTPVEVGRDSATVEVPWSSVRQSIATRFIQRHDARRYFPISSRKPPDAKQLKTTSSSSTHPSTAACGSPVSVKVANR